MQASPNRIGKYELISRLGRGGMGEVYKAFHPQLQRYVAIKVLLTGSETDAEFIARFQNEAMAVARLRHPHIVQVFDFDIDGDKPYMVMEFIEGETLAQRMTRYHKEGKRLPIDEVVRLFQQLCSAVDYAHKQGMLHRDIKPANVILNQQNDAILTDFGLAKISGVSGLTASGTVVGTPHYMSPEQGQGQPMDARSDVYSLSVILYEMLAGKVPFDADTPVGVIMQHIMKPPPPIESANLAVQSALAQVAMLGMAKKPEERFRSAGALGAAVAAAMNQPPAQIAAGGAANPAGGPVDGGTVALGTQPAYRPVAPDAVTIPDVIPTHLPPRPAPAAAQAGKPPAARNGAPPIERLAEAPRASPPALERSRRKAGNQVGRLAVIGIILLLFIIGGGILLIALGNKGNTPTTVTNTPGTAGTVSFSDSDANDFTHPADTLKATFTGLQQPPSGSTYFAWLCDSGAKNCTSLGALQLQQDGSTTLNAAMQGKNFLGVQDVTKLQSTLTFEITQEQAEPSEQLSMPSNTIVYSGHIESGVLLHIRHQLVAFPKGNLFPGNTTALDTGLGEDAVLLNQLAQQLVQKEGQGDLAGMQATAEAILNLVAGKEGWKDWDMNGQTTIAPGDDGFGLGDDATVDNTCAGPQNATYLALTMQHACLAAKASGSADLQALFQKIQKAGANIATSVKQLEQIAQKIATATTASAFSQGDVNTLAEQADAILNGTNGETQNQDGARQIFQYSEAMATITVNPA